MMSKKVNSIATIVALTLSAGLGLQGAQAFTINDPYGSQYDGDCVTSDHCGGSTYDIAGANVSIQSGQGSSSGSAVADPGNDIAMTNHYLNVAIFSNFSEPDAYGIHYGDLFLNIGGVGFVLDTSSAQATGTGAVYQITSGTTLITAGQATPYAGRPAETVLYGSGGTYVGAFNLIETVTGILPYELSYTVSSGILGLATNEAFDLSWAFASGNDILGGTISDQLNTETAVPVPASGLLILAGGLGLWLNQRRSAGLTKLAL